MRAPAFLVHVLTACGAALALLALIAAVHNDWAMMFVWLGAALIVDGIDGPLARALDVKHALPRWSGDTLDLVVDYTTYVFVPAYAVTAVGLMPDKLSILCGIAIAVTGALYFADRNMKTDDNHFRGFPAVWNLIAFYLLVLRLPPLATASVILLFAVLTFVPIRFVHPFRVSQYRIVTLALMALWAVLAIVAVSQRLEPTVWVTAALCLIAVYFLGIGLVPRRGAPT